MNRAQKKNTDYIPTSQPEHYVQDVDGHLEEAKTKALSNENRGINKQKELPLFLMLQKAMNSEGAMEDMKHFAEQYSEYARGSREVTHAQVCDAANKAAEHIGPHLGHELTKKVASYIQAGVNDCLDEQSLGRPVSLDRFS